MSFVQQQRICDNEDLIYFLFQMNLLLKEYLVSGDVSEAERCLRDLEVPHFHHELVYEVLTPGCVWRTTCIYRNMCFPLLGSKEYNCRAKRAENPVVCVSAKDTVFLAKSVLICTRVSPNQSIQDNEEQCVTWNSLSSVQMFYSRDVLIVR